jgi:hypothetical protein
MVTAAEVGKAVVCAAKQPRVNHHCCWSQPRRDSQGKIAKGSGQEGRKEDDGGPAAWSVPVLLSPRSFEPDVRALLARYE